MDVTMQDILQLQQEAGQAENDQRLRAIRAERRVRELEIELAAVAPETPIEDE
jgi:hypothetical protein